METALIQNLKLLAEVPHHGWLRIVPNNIAEPPEPDSRPEDMTLITHRLAIDTRYSWWRPLFRLITGDTDRAIVNYIMLMTRTLDMYAMQPSVKSQVSPALSALVRLQDTTYCDNKFVKLALITCRCAWRQYE
jgi:hypothetical protein